MKLNVLNVALNSEGFREYLRSEEVGALLEEHANSIASQSRGKGTAVGVSELKPSRYIAFAVADSEEFVEENARDNTLLRAFGLRTKKERGQTREQIERRRAKARRAGLKTYRAKKKGLTK